MIDSEVETTCHCAGGEAREMSGATPSESTPTGVELFTEGDALYAAMLASIRSAS